MSEEEIKAIEYFKNIQKYLLLDFAYDKGLNNAINIVVNLVERQQKEIDYLKNH